MREITLLELLKSGVHFGHQTSKWHPKMKPYIFSSRNGVHIINLEITAAKLKEALDFVEEIVSQGGLILFLGSKRQAKEIVSKYAKDCGMPYMTEKWLGGTFTNFSTISKLVIKLKKLRSEFQSGEIKKYSKKERSVIHVKLEKLERLVGGIENMDKLPSAVYVVDIKQEKTAVRESRKKGVAVVAIADTNVDPTLIDHPIPGNDDATKSIELITSLICEAVKDGQAKAEKKQVETEKKEKVMEEKPAKGAVSQPKADKSLAGAKTSDGKETKAKKEGIKVKKEAEKNIQKIEEEEKEVTASQALKS